MSEFFNHKYIYKYLIAILIGVLIGALISFMYFRYYPVTLDIKQIRLGEDKLINPLIAVNVPERISNDQYRDLKKKLESDVEGFMEAGKIEIASIYFKDQMQSDWFSVNGDTTYHPASLLKVPTLIAYYKIAQRKPNFLSQNFNLTLDKDYQSMESIQSSKKSSLGQSYSLEELINMMIIYSDNNAGVFLASLLKTNFLDEVYSDLSLSIPLDRETLLNAEAYSIFFRTLYNSTYLSRELSEKALELLSKTEFTDGLVSGISSTTTIAHKFGEYGHLSEKGTIDFRELHDCGIIYMPNNPYLLCVMTRGKELKALSKVIGDISKTVYDHMLNKHGE